MKYISTRNKSIKVSSAEAIVNGLSKDGGLFVPEEFPKLTKENFDELIGMSYPERVAKVLSLYLEDYTYEELLDFANKAYSRFYGEDPCPLVNVDDGLYVLELWHGPTCAFKDMALTMLPHLLSAARKKTGETSKTLILVATSGDTGKAALEGFRDVEGTDIIVFYPSDGVSDMQKLQMMTQQGENVYVCAIEGNFDDAQSAVKKIFNDAQMQEKLLAGGYKLSSANSINWGRLAPQIAYYVSSYCDLISSGRIKYGDKVNFCVPSGNFGNILAAYYASLMGVGVNKLICASNVNNVLTDFFTTGEYDTHREFHKTMSPSMDILISSNLERLLFEFSGRDDALIAQRMDALKKDGKYSVSKQELEKLNQIFEVGYATEDDTAEVIANCFDVYDYLMDTHTAVAMSVYDDYFENCADETPSVIVSTANAYKFPCDVYDALAEEYIDDAQKATKKLHSYTGEEVPEPLADLDKKQVRFTKVIAKQNIEDEILEYIKK
ncbi:MAG: threonine synthase [Clostridia bacterium]|nr:threonine synthase [Clostridia bacterium]